MNISLFLLRERETWWGTEHYAGQRRILMEWSALQILELLSTKYPPWKISLLCNWEFHYLRREHSIIATLAKLSRIDKRKVNKFMTNLVSCAGGWDDQGSRYWRGRSSQLWRIRHNDDIEVILLQIKRLFLWGPYDCGFRKRETIPPSSPRQRLIISRRWQNSTHFRILHFSAFCLLMWCHLLFLYPLARADGILLLKILKFDLEF